MRCVIRQCVYPGRGFGLPAPAPLCLLLAALLNAVSFPTPSRALAQA